ncbi:non-specific serine/threonine protein kinase [Ranunculus cassubicifolius]
MRCFCKFFELWREKEKKGDEEIDSWDLFYEFRTLEIATNCFDELNQLGYGGFGPVFKGLLPSGELVAVKKLSLNSKQGVKEFTNEVKLLLKIQHKNLVTLLGCCVEGPEKMLVYEYLPNKSLDYFLFDKDKSASLDWSKRFAIIIGVARGLLYLHEEAPERIIHRDIKASNILLDEQLKPKISDFGLARLFPGDGTHLSTFQISGTYGYMAPEYTMHGVLSVKTDVYSFGILVLEIVTGRKNHDKNLDKKEVDLLYYTWTLWQQGKMLELIDPKLEKMERDEAAMCIHLGLLCCQATVAERPNMNTVHLMLSSDSFTLPKPGKPGFQGRRGRYTVISTAPTITNTDSNSTSAATKTSCSGSTDFSRNSISVSFVDEGR